MANDNQKIENRIRGCIRNIPDFPSQGIQFKDITPLLKNPAILRETSKALVDPFSKDNVDYVVGLESRGFLLGPRLAQDLEAGFIPIRKPDKLPAKTVSATYQLEYGEDTLQMHADALAAGDRVLIHDDLIATGGSAKAATQLIRKLEAQVAGYSFIIALEELNGFDKLYQNARIETLVSF